MTELIIGLLGSGVLVQLVNTLATLRQSRRQLNASALGTEIEALEKTIAILSSSFDLETERHRKETDYLRQRIATLEERIATLNRQLLDCRVQLPSPLSLPATKSPQS